MAVASNKSDITISTLHNLIDNMCSNNFGIDERIKYALLTLFPDIVDCLTMSIIDKIKVLITKQTEMFDGIKDVFGNITATMKVSGKIEIGQMITMLSSLKANPIEAYQVFSHIIYNSDNIKETFIGIVREIFSETSSFSDFVFRFIVFIIIEAFISSVDEYSIYARSNKHVIKEIIKILYESYTSNEAIQNILNGFLLSIKKHKKAYLSVKHSNQ